jgi:hypothetical protein
MKPNTAEQDRAAALTCWLMDRAAEEPLHELLEDCAAPFDFAESDEAAIPAFADWPYRRIAQYARAQMAAILDACRPNQALLLLATAYGWKSLVPLDASTAHVLAAQYTIDSHTCPNGTQAVLSDGSALPMNGIHLYSEEMS